MASRSKLPALLIVVLSLLACQFLRPAPRACQVNLPAVGQVTHSNGDQVTFTMDEISWSAQVDCASGHLVEGQPVRPYHAREIMIPVEESSYRLISSDPNASMKEYHENGSHVRIDVNGGYYAVVLSASPGIQGQAMVSYFMAGENAQGIVHLHCYNRTRGEDHVSMPTIAAMWTVTEAVPVSLVCSGQNFILEASTDITDGMLKQGPTLVPPTPGPTLTPEPLGPHSGQGSGS